MKRTDSSPKMTRDGASGRWSLRSMVALVTVALAATALVVSSALIYRMLADLLDVARIEAGHLELRIEPAVDVRGLARNVTELFADSAAKGRIALSLPDAPVPVRCDPLRIEQTLNNLVSNAIKYSPEGGEVVVRVGTDDGSAVVAVSDHGIGIAAEDLALVWEPFRRTGVSAELAPGVGLGLSIARRIVDAHHGAITVESAPGVGSTFTVLLPLADAGRTGNGHETQGRQERPS